MAELIPPMLIKLQADVSDLKVGLAQAQREFGNFGDTVTKQTSFLAKFKAATAGVFAGNLMTTGLMTLKSAFSGAIQDAQQYEQLLNKTRAVMASTGGVAGVTTKHIQDQASALENLAAVDENVILNGQNVIATFTNIRNVAGAGNDIFDQTTKAALDLSAALGQDMQSSAIQLGKALNDPIQGMVALRRVGVSFDAAQQATIKRLVETGHTLEAQKLILAEVNREFGGAAKAAGDTFAGAVFRAKDKAQDFARDLITNLQPILLNIGKTIGKLYDTFLKPLFTWIGKNKEAVLAFVAVLGTAYLAMKAWGVILAVNKVIQEAWAVATTLMKGAQLASIASTNGMAASMLALNAVMRANPIGVVVTALGLLAAGFVYAWNKSETFRNIVVGAFQAVIHGVAYGIRALSDFVGFASKYLMIPFKTLLGALSHLPGVGKYAKEALKFMDNIPNVLDNAANKVDGFANSLEKLQNKKISIPGLGGSKDTTADAQGKATTAAEIATKAQGTAQAKAVKQLQAYQKKVQGIYDDMNKVLAKAEADKADALDKKNTKILEAQQKFEEEKANLMERYNEAIASATKKHDEDVLKIEKDFAKRKLDIETAYNEKVASIRSDAAKKAVDLTASATQKQIDIVQQSIDRLRSAFASKTTFSLTEAFGAGATGTSLVGKLQASLTGAKTLQANAASLAGLGYSQTFIEEVVKNGPEIGNKMAEALKQATPETTKQLQDLYKEVQDVSNHGLDTLAKTMNSGGQLATEELMNAFNQVQVDLKNSLAVVNTEMEASLVEATKNFNTSMTEAQVTRDEALAESLKAFNEAKANAQADLDKGLADAQKTLQKALIDAQNEYNKALDEINKATAAKLADLKASLLEIAGLMAALGAGGSVGVSSPSLIPNPAAPADYASYASPWNFGGTGAGTTPVYVINTNVSGYNLTSPSQTAQNVVSNIKYSQAVKTTSTVATKSTSKTSSVPAGIKGPLK